GHRHVAISSYNESTTTTIYPLSLHDALPISAYMARRWRRSVEHPGQYDLHRCESGRPAEFLKSPEIGARRLFDSNRPSRPSRVEDRKSTRLNSSHVAISYAVFCLKKQSKRHC